MLQWLTENLAQGLLVLGLVLLITDMVLLGFSTFVFTFFGVSLLVTGILVWVGLLPATWIAVLWSNAVLTSVLALLLWKPLRQLQNKKTTTIIDNDFAQQQFVLEHDVDSQLGQATYQYSGVRWKLKSTEAIAAGTTVQVVRSEVGVLWVSPVEG